MGFNKPTFILAIIDDGLFIERRSAENGSLRCVRRHILAWLVTLLMPVWLLTTASLCGKTQKD